MAEPSFDIVDHSAEILSKLEAFEQALNILQPFLELMDRFLAPLLPAINAIAQVIVTIVTGILTPLFPIIKTVATLIITICTVVEISNSHVSITL